MSYQHKYILPTFTYKAKKKTGMGWVYGYLYEEDGKSYIKNTKLGRGVPVFSDTVCVSIGRKDDFDKDVYIGDCFWHESEGTEGLVRFMIVFEDGIFLARNLDEVIDKFIDIPEKIAITCNIIDRPELLKPDSGKNHSI